MTTESIPTETNVAPEAELMAQVRRGDPASCGDLVACFGDPLYSYLYWLTGTVDEATTVFKDTFLYLYLNPSRVRKEPSVKVWLYRHVTQTWLQIRQRQRQGRSSLDKILRGGLKKTTAGPWEDWIHQCTELAEADTAGVTVVVRELDVMSDQERAALLLHTIPCLSLSDIASSLRISPRKARSRIVSAFSEIVGGDVEHSLRKARNLACWQALGLATPRQERNFSQLCASQPEAQQFLEEGATALATLQAFPIAQRPDGLSADTESHLAEGHAALETRMATWGFRFMLVTVPVFILAILAIILLPAVSRSREMARRAAASDNLHILGKALRAYSDTSYGNRFPPLVPEKGLWVPNLAKLYPRFIGNPATLVSPGLNDPALVTSMREALEQSPPDWKRAHRLFARSYVYTGYTLLDGDAMAAFMALRKSDETLDLEGDVETDDRRFFRLRQGVEQFFAGDIHVEPGEETAAPLHIPIMFEVYKATGFGGNPEGANVLYLDGTVEYVPFGSAFPVDAAVLAMLGN